jgi:hypothetical protein
MQALEGKATERDNLPVKCPNWPRLFATPFNELDQTLFRRESSMK